MAVLLGLQQAVGNRAIQRAIHDGSLSVTVEVFCGPPAGTISPVRVRRTRADVYVVTVDQQGRKIERQVDGPITAN